MNDFREVIKNRINKLNYLIGKKREALARAPEGSLRISRSHNTIQYYNGDSYICKKDRSLARQLAQKGYDEKVIDSAECEIAALELALLHYPELIAELVYQAQLDARMELIRPIITPDDEYVRKWLAEPYVHKGFPEDFPEIYSNKGDRVRSKSEKLLADMIFAHNVPYRYECPLENEYGDIIHPDFTILNVRTRELFYWEHCGKFDDPYYTSDLDDRLRFYGRLGIFPGQRLLLTTETSKRPIDMRLAEKMLKDIFL